MIIDGKAIAQAILEEVKTMVAELPSPPFLTVFTCEPNFETQKFLQLKQKRAAEVGINVELVALDPLTTTEMIVAAIVAAVATSDGIIVQLPFPGHIDTWAILAAVPSTHDVDALRYCGEETDIFPPVVGAIDAIATTHNVLFTGRSVVVVGQGRLVGTPAAAYARTCGARVTVVLKDTLDASTYLAAADILILGAGVPGLVSAEQIKLGAVVLDAGTSEEGGMLVGDADSSVASVASLFTPVPGGIGPITIAILLRNLVKLATRS